VTSIVSIGEQLADGLSMPLMATICGSAKPRSASSSGVPFSRRQNSRYWRRPGPVTRIS
jgi:hypothetical protein